MGKWQPVWRAALWRMLFDFRARCRLGAGEAGIYRRLGVGGGQRDQGGAFPLWKLCHAVRLSACRQTSCLCCRILVFEKAPVLLNCTKNALPLGRAFLVQSCRQGPTQHLTALYIMVAYSTGNRKGTIALRYNFRLNYHLNSHTSSNIVSKFYKLGNNGFTTDLKQIYQKDF